jgi:hypothetical protein
MSAGSVDKSRKRDRGSGASARFGRQPKPYDARVNRILLFLVSNDT